MRHCLKQLILFMVLFSGWRAFAQQAELYGRISDGEGRGLYAALVYIENTAISATAGENGEYKLLVPANSQLTLVASYLGRRRSFEISLAEGERRKFDIKIEGVIVIGPADVVVSGDREKPIQRIDPKVQAFIPSVRGSIEDLLIQAPVNFTSELSSSYSVRGGSFDENLVYVNDIQVYRPFLVRAGEQEGLSFPNPDMVDNIEFSAGGFESRYGDRLSSVLDIRYRKPREFGGTATMSMLGVNLHLEGTDSTHRFTHNSGFRYRNNSYVLGSLDTQGDYNPAYLDFQTYLTYQISDLVEIAALGNYSRNTYNFIPTTRQTNVGTINEALRLTIFFEGQEVSAFETGFGALALNYRPDEFTTLKFIGSAFQTYEQETFDILGQYFLDELERDFGSDQFGEVVRNRGVGGFLEHARNDLEAGVQSFSHIGKRYLERSDNLLEWGVSWQGEQISDRLSEWTLVDSAGYSTPRPLDSLGYTNPDLQEYQEIELRDVIKARNDLQSNRYMAFIQDTWTYDPDSAAEFTVNAGVRVQHWDFNGQTIITPRGNISWRPYWITGRKEGRGLVDTLIRRDIVFTLAGGLYYQPPFYREMRGINGLVNPDIEAQKSYHIVAGIDYLFNAWGRPFKLISEVYYKGMTSLIPYEVENVRLRYYARNNAVGYATGLDVMLNGEFIPGVQSWMRASVLKTEEDLNDDAYYEYYNASGEQIIPGFTFDQNRADSVQIVPGYIPRPTDQRFTFSMFFQDEMPKWEEYKVQLTFYYGTGLPYGPPTFERYKDILRTTSYRRVDVGFSREFVTDRNRDKTWLGKNFKYAFVALEIFNILGINNTINHTWIEDVDGRLYAVPNFLTGRRLNVKLACKF